MTTNIRPFINAIKAEMQSRLYEFELTEKDIVKMNDIKMHGLVARRKGENAGATVYLDEAFDSFRRGESLVSIADTMENIILNADNHKPVTVNNDIDLSFDTVRDKLTLRLVDIEKNTQYLEDHPHRIIGAGLAVVAEINLGNDYSIVVSNSVAEDYDIVALFDTALENMQNLYPASLVSLESAIFGNGENALESDEHIEGAYTLMIAEGRGYGASALVYKDMTEKIRTLFDGDFYILPSSLHETILIKADGTVNIADLKAMVIQANRSVVDPVDVLSDSVFYFGSEGLCRIA